MQKKVSLFIMLFIILIIIIAFACRFLNSNDTNILADDEDEKNNVKNEDMIENEVKEENIDIFSKYYDKAEELLNTMTLEEKVGQMFLVRYPKSGVIQEIQNENPGGYILFGNDFKDKTKQEVINELLNNQENSKIKLILAVDEEGGTVVRVSSNPNFRSSKFKSPQQLFKQGGHKALIEDSKEKSALLKSIGINMNLAPVVDVPTRESSFIYARAFGTDAKETAKYAEEIVNTMNEDCIISVIKHFPGYGDNVDTHTGIAIDTRDYSVFENSDFLPFISGIKAKVPVILVNHNIINCMDSKPASLSENVHKILRKNLNFSGIIMTDDLAMDAVKKYVENGEAAVEAVLAGNDMIITSNFKLQKEEVIKAVKNGKIQENVINKAVKRILACKYHYNIISNLTLLEE